MWQINVVQLKYIKLTKKKYIRLVIATGSHYGEQLSKHIILDVVEVYNHERYIEKP